MKKIYLLLTLLTSLNIIYGQQNLAPQATASASTCNTGACATLNDLNFGTCGTQQMWITSAATNPGSAIFIQFVWPTTRVLNKIKFHVAQNTTRFLGGGTIQIWNGAAWVNHRTFTQATGVCDYEVSFTNVATTQLRIIDIVVIGTQSSNVNFREIEIFGPVYNFDAGVSEITKLNPCNLSQGVRATVLNYGKRTMDSFRLHWSINNTLISTQYITSTLTSGQSATYNLSTSYTFSPNTVYDIRAWTTNPQGATTDSGASNDLFLYKYESLGTPSDPLILSTKQCGQGNVNFTGVPASNADSIMWFDQTTGGNLLGVGRKTTGPFITSDKTFYASSSKIASISTYFSNTASSAINVTQANEHGTMFSVTAVKDFRLDSLRLRLNYATPTNMGYQLYYRVGTYTGFQTNASAWTKLNEGVANFITVSGTNYARLSAKNLYLFAGQTYSFYMTTDLALGAGNSFLNTLSAPTTSNEDLSLLTNGSIILGKFGSTSVTANYLPDVTFIYKKQCYSSTRLPYAVTVKPRPIGATAIAGTPFKGQFKLGNNSSPDVLEVGKTNVYEITPPSGFTNSDHTVTWVITNVSARTKFNVLVPASEYTVTYPTPTSNGKLTFIPKSAYLDSFITFSVTFIDLGPHFCDSTITRTVYVAPTPKTSFKPQAVACAKNDVVFDNTTTIHSGTVTYMWYFGDGDSSDFISPIHIFDNPGIYNVRLVAKSDNWNVVKDSIIPVTVGEVPKVKFSLVNRCIGTPITFNNQTTITSGTLNYLWKFGDGTTQSNNNNNAFTKSYSQAGIYYVTLYASSANGCTDSFSKNAYQFTKPVANYSLLEGACINKPFKFVNNSTIALGDFGNTWNFDDGGAIATDENPTYTFSTPGMKKVVLKNTSEFNCIDSIIKQIEVKVAPETDFTFPFACERTPTPFTNTTDLKGESLSGYKWDFGQGSPVTIASPTVSWTSLGNRNVKLTTTLTNGCSSEMVKTINVGVQPLVDFELENKCVGEEATFTNLTTHRFGNITYEWVFGDGNKSTQQSPKYTYANAQTFFVKLKASVENGCTDSTVKSINISPLPTTCDFNFARTYNVNSKSFTFTPTGGSMNGIKYTWLMGDGNKVNTTGAGTVYTYDNTIKYCVTMIASNQADCECSVTKCLDAFTNIQDISLSDYSIYPNPSNGVFNIRSKSTNNPITVEIYNVLGEVINIFSFDNTTEASIDLSANNNGMYIIKILDGNQVFTGKVNILK